MVATATLIAFTASADFIPKFFNVPLYPFGYLSMLTYIILVGHSIVRYRVFDIETVIHKTAMWLLSFSLLLIPIISVYNWLSPYMGSHTLLEIAFWIIALVSLALYLRVIQPKIDHFFQRRKSNLEEISSRFIDDLVHLKGLSQLVQRIDDTIAETLYPQHIDIFLYDENRRIYKLANITDKPHDIVGLPDDNKFLQWLAEHNKITHKDFVDIDPAYGRIKEEAADYFDLTGAVLVVPLVLNERLLGVINLGKKASLRRYTGSEFHFLTTLKNQATIAISNSLLYENMEEQVRQRTKELVDVQKQLIQAEKMATVGTLAGGVAHEINNPLTAILTNVQMLLSSDAANNKEDRESLELIEEATKRCRTIVQKLMTYARKPLETTDISSVNLLVALKNVTSFLGYQLEQDNIKINTHAKKSSYTVMGNHNEFEQVFTNLILNSRDSIRKIKKHGSIDISFTEGDNWIKVEVKDDGAGIPREISSKIFDPFFTTKDVGKGVGLGLSISQAIVEKYKGVITFKSEPNNGATFMITMLKAEKTAMVTQDAGPKNKKYAF